MKPGESLAVWSGAIALAVLFVFSVIHRSDYHAVFVGTSLLDHAVPDEDPVLAELLGGPFEKHVHLGVRRHEILREIRLAESADSKFIFIELSHFLYQLHGNPRETGWFATGWMPLRQAGHAMLANTRTLGLEALSQLGVKRHRQGDRLDLPYQLRPERLEAIFPLRPGPTIGTAQLAQVIREKKNTTTEVILIVPPFSELAHQLAGDGAIEEIARLASELSLATGAPLFMPAHPWPDSFYIDSSHLNRAGRERFRTMFVDWFQLNRGAPVDS